MRAARRVLVSILMAAFQWAEKWAYVSWSHPSFKIHCLQVINSLSSSSR